MSRYSYAEAAWLGLSLAAGKVAWRGARLIRQPFYLHGKKHLRGGVGFTAGYGCRFDLGDKPGVTGTTLDLGRDIEIGDHCHIVANEHVELGDGCLLASKVFISDTSHGAQSGPGQEGPDVPPRERTLVTDPVCIGKNVWLGDNVVVLPGVTIGDGCIVGANAVVAKDLPPATIAVGVPARVVKVWDEAAKEWVRA